MGIILTICLVSFLIMILGIIIYESSYNLEWLGEMIGYIAGIVMLITGCMWVSLIGSKENNQRYFNVKQQEYIVLTQYIKSNKSDSILESEKMLERITNYNEYVIEKQNAMTRPIRKYWVEGADWNQLKLIDLNNKESE